MPLTDEQRAKLEAAAKERGLDPAALIREAEKIAPRAGQDDDPGSDRDEQPKEQPKLFMYLLPFVTVREVRQVWLGLKDSFPGDSEVAAAWAAKQAPSSGGGQEPEEP